MSNACGYGWAGLDVLGASHLIRLVASGCRLDALVTMKYPNPDFTFENVNNRNMVTKTAKRQC